MKKSTVLLLAVSAVFSTVCQAAQLRVDADPDGEVSIDVFAGSVVVMGWDENAVTAEGNWDEDELVLERDGKVVELGDESGGDWHNDTSMQVTVRVPRRSGVRIETVSADVEVRDITGRIQVESVSGRIEVSTISDEAELETVSGEIIGRLAASRLSVDSVSGEINLVNDSELVDGSLSTASGEILLDTSLAPRGNVDLESISGDISLALRGEINARFGFETGPGGDIENGLTGEAPRRERYVGSESLELQIGDGSADVEASVVSGKITVKKN